MDISKTPQVMGILNCTPDSFFDGSRKQSEEEIAERSLQIIREGGDIIDVGAYSTRPGAMEVSEEEEIRRLRHALPIIRREVPDSIISVDTFRTTVARMCVEEYGVQIINDISGGCDDIFRLSAKLDVWYLLMSQKPDTASIIDQFTTVMQQFDALGHSKVILDPGFGFGKDVVAGNFTVLREMQRIKETFPQLPLLAGMSRKRMIWHVLGCTPSDDAAMQGTMLVDLIALQNGADILRVHDVKEAVDTIKIFSQLTINS